MEDVCGVAQLCSGLRAGMEGAIHAVRELFDLHSDDGWGVLLVDTRNAFNSVNRVAALWNARVLAFFSTATMDMLDCLFRGLIIFCLVRKV